MQKTKKLLFLHKGANLEKCLQSSNQLGHVT